MDLNRVPPARDGGREPGGKQAGRNFVGRWGYEERPRPECRLEYRVEVKTRHPAATRRCARAEVVVRENRPVIDAVVVGGDLVDRSLEELRVRATARTLGA